MLEVPLDSRVTLEAALDGVGFVFPTRVRLRIWYAITVRFMWVELKTRVNADLVVVRRSKLLATKKGIYCTN